MNYVVKPGDSLWKIAGAWFGEPEKWKLIAEDNRLFPSQRLAVGQSLHLRDSLVRQPTTTPPAASGVVSSRQQEHAQSVIPGRAYILEAGHDRCPVPIKPEYIDAWLTPDPTNLDALDAILEDKARPHYGQRLAASDN